MAQYRRLPTDVATFSRAEFPGVLVYAAGGGEAHSAEEAEWEHAMARTCSRVAAGMRAFHAWWDSLQRGVELMLAAARREGVEARQPFSQSFGPNRRLRNECSGSGAQQEACSQAAFNVVCVGATSGGQRLSASPHLQGGAARAAFGLAARWPWPLDGEKHLSGASAGASVSTFSRGCCPDAARGGAFWFHFHGRSDVIELRSHESSEPARHFSAQLVHFRRALLSQMRILAGDSRALCCLPWPLSRVDQTFFVFRFVRFGKS